MTLTKEQVQNRVLQNGKPISLDLFTWDEKTRTFSSSENGLVLDFKGLNSINFKTGSHCNFITGFDCTFRTYSNCNFITGSHCNFRAYTKCNFITGFDCIFKTSDNCTFKTSDNCTFDTHNECTFTTGSECVIIRRDKFEIIEPKENQTIKLCPYNIPGYLKQKGDKWVYSEDENEENEYIIIDNILSRVLSKRKGIYKVINYGEEKQTYIVQDGDIYSHGESISEAVESIRYKIGNRDKTEYENMSVETELNEIEAIRMYRVITGACEAGTKYFVEQYEKQNDKKEVYRIKEIIEMTKGQYGNDKLIQFFK